MRTTLTINSPEIKPMVEYAFTSNGIKYYNFKKDTSMRYGRYIILQAFLQEYYLRVDLETLRGNIKQLEDWLNPPANKENARIEVGKCLELLSIMRQRANIAFEPDTVYRLASCLYVDAKENVASYDKKHNDLKIKRWKENGTVDFFYHRLFKELTHLTITSNADLEAYLEKVPELLRGWSTLSDILTR